ncbi:MAG: hypothetical protein CM15mP116_05180 [Synechococcus sp.]|nr:MAG: hypothetical protein CM15mP116_05180 [Synechococcus sp.]
MAARHLHGNADGLMDLQIGGSCSLPRATSLFPNVRGSLGAGVDYINANTGDLGGIDYIDVISGVDQLVADGLADPDRLGIGGYSYGGYLSSWAITQTTRFKAAVSGGIIADWVSFYGTTDIPHYLRVFLEAPPSLTNHWQEHDLQSTIQRR